MSYPKIVFSEHSMSEYQSYERVLHMLLSYVPKKYLVGLQSIFVLRAKDLSRYDKRERIGGKSNKVDKQKCLGFYSRPWKGKAASITLYIDNI